MKNKIITALSFVATRWLYKFKSEKQVRAFQEKMLIKHFKFLREVSPYFASMPNVDKLERVSRLPIMDKSTMMQNFNEINTVGLDKSQVLDIAINSERTRNFDETYNGIAVGLSSGTSGHRGVFVVSERERSAWAGAVLAKFLPKGKIFGHRIAFFLRANNNLYETVGSKLIKFKYFDIYDNMENNIIALNHYKPSILVAPPSILSIIANRVESGEFSIFPDKIISVAEVLTELDEKRFLSAFRVDIIFQAYQCTEGFLAYTCESGTLHLNEDIVYIEKELLDERRFVPIITDFKRTSQPIVRYRLNDILVLSTKQCPCGSAMTAIDHIEGREDDIFVFRGSSAETIFVFPDMMSRCMLYVENITEYRIVQINSGALEVYVDNISDEVQEAVEDEIKQLASKLSFKMPMIKFMPYEVDLCKKLKRIERR